jgi:S-formylglutathione hydrolase FrmB
VSEPENTPADGPEGSPHSARSIALRVLAAVAVAAGFFAIDRVWLQDDPLREQFGATVRTFEVESDRLGRTLPAKVVVPKKAPTKGRSLLVFLHGRGEDERSYLVEPMFEALSGLAGRAPVIAFPFGGESSYWHNRDSGAWASYVLFEVIPQIADRYDVDPDRIAIGGISMGGFGAFDIARIDPERFCAVGGHSPAIWENAGDTADGAFDDTEDFESNDVIEIAGASDPSPYAGLRVWLDAGDDDPFLAADEALEDALREGGARPVVKRSPGGHDSGYWNGNWDEYFGFYAHALAECTVGDEPKEDRPAASDPGSRQGASGSSSRRNGAAARSGD